MDVNQGHVKNAIDYTVDGVTQETTEAVMTVRQILQGAGLDPENHYLVELRGANQIDHKNLDEQLRVHEKDQFISVFTGPTPLS